MSLKKGIPLARVDGVDGRLQAFLRSRYGISTAEELVEAASATSTLAEEAATEAGMRFLFDRAVDAARQALGSARVHELEHLRHRFATGALKPGS